MFLFFIIPPQVFAANSAGEGNASQAVNFTTFTSPPALNVTMVTTGAAVVSCPGAANATCAGVQLTCVSRVSVLLFFCVCLSSCLPACLDFSCLVACPSFCLSVYLSVCLSICTSVHAEVISREPLHYRHHRLHVHSVLAQTISRVAMTMHCLHGHASCTGPQLC